MNKLIIITIIVATTLIRAGEIVPVWQTVWDIDPTSSYQKSLGQQFLKGHDQFMIILVDSDIGSIQIRETLSGEILDSIRINNVYEENKFKVLPDSNRFIMSVGGIRNIQAGFEVRSLEDFSIINKFELPLEGDAFDERNRPYNNRIIDIKIDPVKPYVYFILEKGINGKQFGENTDFYSIKVYNYETSEEVRELRTYERDYMKTIDISYDGKHLASLNDGESYLNVWDLESYEQVSSQKMFKKAPEIEWWVETEDIKFDLFDSSIIYFSGVFQDLNDTDKRQAGVYKYELNSESFQNLTPDYRYDGKLIFIENQKILFLNSGFRLLFFDFINKDLELLTLQPNDFLIGTNTIYSAIYKSFISSNSNQLNSFQYLTETKVEISKELVEILFPNPTTNNIQIETCSLTETRIELFNINGIILKNEVIPVTDGLVTYDLSGFPSGSYFVRLNCGEEIRTYNVIKEN